MENFGSWSVLTTNFLLVLFIALAGMVFCSILHLVNGKWRYQVRFLAASLAALFPVAFVLLLILLFNGEATFQWLASAHDGEHHLPVWHDYTFLVARQIIGMLCVMALSFYFIKLQYLTSVDNSPAVHRRFRNVALLIPFMYVLYGTMIAWDFEMTMMPNWHSASYGAYFFVSSFQFFLAFFVLFLFFLNRSGKLAKPFKPFVFNYLAQMMLGFTILWTYFYFTQYIIMWYGRLPEEMGRYDQMMLHDLAPIWWTFLALKFIIPFVTFAVWTPNRHNPVVIIAVASCIVVGTWLEQFTWISGSIETEHYHIPMTSIFDIVVTIAVIAVSWFAVKLSLNKYGIVKAS
jgi:hypothetical protein